MSSTFSEALFTSVLKFHKDYPGIDFDSVSRQLAYDFFLAEFGFYAADSQQMILQALRIHTKRGTAAFLHGEL